MADDDSTDLQPRADLNLTALRQRPVLEWRDARGPHAVEIDGRITLGSSENVGAVIGDRAVSRLHAELEVRKDGVWIRDLGSLNGAYVGGVLVQSAQVPLGKPFVLGSTQLQVTVSSQARSVPLWPEDHYGPLYGVSETMRELFIRLAQYAATDSPVLVHGETGTGKELVAEAIHEASARREEPFVVVDCAALPETLLESELFGHTRGSFTGATSGRTGAFESAQGGDGLFGRDRRAADLDAAEAPPRARVAHGAPHRRDRSATRQSAVHRGDASRLASDGRRRELP